MFAGQMIGHKLITKQTGANGRLCNAVYICERKFARREFYLAILMDRQSQSPVIVSSSQGGMDIETVAKESPDAIRTTRIDINVGVTDEIARNIATELGFSEQCIEDAKDSIQRLYKIFMERMLPRSRSTPSQRPRTTKFWLWMPSLVSTTTPSLDRRRSSRGEILPRRMLMK